MSNRPRVEHGELILHTGARISMPLPVLESVEFRDFIVVCLSPTGKVNQNIFAVANDGTQLWQIGRTAAEDYRPGPFLGVSKKNADILLAVHSSGITFEVDAKTGRVLAGILAK